MTSYDPSHSFLSPFNIHRQVLGVLGLASSNGDPEVVAQLEQAPSALRQLHPSAVVHRVFAFDTGAARPQTMDLSSMQEASVDENQSSSNAKALDSSAATTSGFSGRGHAGLYVFPAVRKDMKDVRFYLKTLIPELVSALIEGLGTFVKDLQGKPLETPRETLDGALGSVAQSAVANKSSTSSMGAAASSAASRASALFSSFSAHDETSRKTSRGSKAMQSIISGGATGSGRYAKIKADYHLLIGDLWSALQGYDSCMSLLGKERALAGGQDAVWYASALEGWAVARVLVARMGGLVEERAPSLHLPLGGTKEKEKDKASTEQRIFAQYPWADIAEAYTLALRMYGKCLAPPSYLLETMRSVTPDTPRDYTHPLIHTSACLAYSRFLLAIWASGGWNAETFDQLLIGGVPPALAETTRPTVAVYMQHSTASGIERSDISTPASEALTNSSTNALKLLDQLHLYASIAAIFGCIGYTRKETYAIQRLQALVVALIAQGIHMQKEAAAPSSEALKSGNASLGTMTTQTITVGAGHGSDSILVLALQICQTYGINIQYGPLIDLAKTHILYRASADAKSGKHLSSPMVNRNRASWSYAMSSLQGNDAWQKHSQEEAASRLAAANDPPDEPPFGWTEQQIMVLKDTISICEMLQDNEALLFFALILLRDFWPMMSAEDQMKLKNGIASIMKKIDTKDTSAMLQYWGPRDLLVSITLDPSAASHPSKADIADARGTHQKSHTRAAWQEKRHISASEVSTKDDVLVEDEASSFVVMLQNPLLVPIEVESMHLELVGVGNLCPKFESAKRTAITLPPSSLHGVRLSGIPRGQGKIMVKGVSIKLPYCAERTFTLEHIQHSNEKTLIKAKSDVEDRWTRTKRYGLDARGSASTGQGRLPKAWTRKTEASWILSVIAKVPLLSIHPSSILRNGTVAMCDGEERLVTLQLHNRSGLKVDHIHFVFDDNAQRDAVELLSEGQLDAPDKYELEHDLLHQPFITLANPDGFSNTIEPGHYKTFAFSVHGKIDVHQASIRILYGNVAEGKEMGRDQFWVREAVFSFNVRVLPTVYLDSLDVAHVPADNQKTGSVLISMAAHNAHPSTVEIRLPTQQGFDSSTYENVKLLPAHASTRLHMIIHRLPATMRKTLRDEIPSLIERQFVVSRVQQSKEESEKQRLLFWARHSLLHHLFGSTDSGSCSWRDVHSGVHGTVALTGLRLDNTKIIDSLYEDTISITLQLTLNTHSSEAKDMQYFARANEFIQVQATFTNHLDKPISANYRLLPWADDRQSNQQVLCTSGHLQGHIASLIPSKSHTLSIGLSFLTRGSYFGTLICTNNENAEQVIGQAALPIHVD